MSDTRKLIEGYSEGGLSAVLKGAAALVDRASFLLGEIKVAITPPAVSQAYRKEAACCLAEAEELISSVRAEGRL